MHLWKIDTIPQPPAGDRPYAGSAQRVYKLSGKETYENDIYGSMKNEEHPLKGSNKFEWDVPAYTVFDKLEEEKMHPPAGTSSYKEYKKKEGDTDPQEDMTNSEVLDYTKKLILSKGVSGFITLNKLMKREDKGGKIGKEALDNCLKQLGIKLIPRNLDKLCKLFDVSNKGEIAQKEFFETIVLEMTPARASLVEKVFDRLDRDRDGFIDIPDIVAVYNPRNHPDVLSKKRTQKEILAQFLDLLESHLKIIVHFVFKH